MKCLKDNCLSLTCKVNLQNIKRLVLLFILVILFTCVCSAAPIVIAANGESTFTIVVPQKSPISVLDAANEMQRDIEESTGAKLTIAKDNDSIKSTFISLGATKQAAAADINIRGMKDSSYRIVTKNGNLYIIGPDTTTEDMSSRWWDNMEKVRKWEAHPEIPGRAFTKEGGFSTGTANGVYTFLEDYLGMRWLMPGDIGRDIPKKNTFTINNIDRTDIPPFKYRVMVIIGSPMWRKHMKLGYSYNLKHTHAHLLPDSLYKEHPDWFAMGSNGQRLDPRKNQGKLETTNQNLVRYIADEAIKELKAHPEWETFSISPSDGLGFSQSPESKAYYDMATITPVGPSITPLILKFYMDVSNIVAKKYPQGKLSGYLYSAYRYPPSQVGVRFPPNFVPVLVSAGNSFAMLNPETREKELNNIDAWGKYASEDWFYYAYPSYIEAGAGMVTPVGPQYLNDLFRTLAKNHIKGVNYYGSAYWGQTALPNYVAAKLLWDPNADAVKIQHDWLMRAYGPKAGAVMEDFYNEMCRKWYYGYYSNPANPRGSRATEAFFSGIFGKYYPEMEKMVLKAESQPMTDIQKERLRLISNNMRLLQWRLRNARYLPQNYSSPYTINSKQAFQLISHSDTSRGFNTFGSVPFDGSVQKVDVQIGKTTQNDAKDIPNADRILLYSTKSEIIHINPTDVQPGSTYLYYYIRDGKGHEVQRGILSEDNEITFDAKANTSYYLKMIDQSPPRNTQAKWDISIPGSTIANASFDGKTVTLSAPAGNASSALHVYVPGQMNLDVTDTKSTVLIQPQSSEQKTNQALRTARIEADAAQKAALLKYSGTLIQSLNWSWEFTTDPEDKGDQSGFAKTDFNDKKWSKVTVIGSWQLNGFPDYHGTAWYRKTFTVSQETLNEPDLMDNKQFLLFVGAVDGDAVFYLNGQKVAERNQADYFNSWQVPFAIDVNSHLIPGKNVLAVKVTKNRLAAGLYKGVSLIAGNIPKL